MIRVDADKSKCEGYANCVIAAPDAFDLGPDGFVVVLKEEFDEGQRAGIEDAVHSCPVSALSIRSAQ